MTWRIAHLVTALVFVNAMILLAVCGKDSSSPVPTRPDPPPPPPPAQPMATRITISPASSTLDAVGRTVRLTATVLDQNDNVLAGASVTWSSSDALVASVDANGLVTAVGGGSVRITARSGSISATASVSVMLTATRITIAPESAALDAFGETVSFNAKVLDVDDAEIRDAVVTWSSSNVRVASVNPRGLVTAVGNGSAQITARSGSLSASASVSVMQTATMIAIAPESDTLVAVVGQTVQLAATVQDRNGHGIAGEGVTWSSDNTAVADVSAQGELTALSPGSARITATSGNLSAGITVTVQMASPDRDALVAIYHALDGPNWTYNTHWTSELPVDEWYGVTLDADRRVSALNLGNNNLKGAIPAELASLDGLTGLALDSNSISGPLLPELGRLTNLTHLYLFGNRLSGGIPPELGQLANLIHLCLDGNQFSGSVPPELGRLSNLKWLHLHGNSTLFGTLPLELTSLKLDALLLQGTQLCVPADAGFETWLRRIADRRLGNCGEFIHPDAVVLTVLYHATGGPNWDNNAGWLTNEPLNSWAGVVTDSDGTVTGLFLQENNLQGRIPPELGRLEGLVDLSLHGNELTGPIPPELAELTHLERLHLIDNSLSGEIPAALGRLANLEGLDLANNRLTGTIPAELGQIENLLWLSLDHNRLYGKIPEELAHLSSVQSMTFHRNQLTGAIPPALGRISSLTHIRLAHNKLGGAIPPELGQLSQLETLTLNNNLLNGNIPPELGGLQRLVELRLGENFLSGTIPAELGGLSNLRRIELQKNAELSGSLMRSFLNLKLDRLILSGTRVCVPGDPEFRSWLAEIGDRSARHCRNDEELGPAPETEREVLTLLYNRTGGPNWTNKQGWLSDQPLDQWHGVTTDAAGSVTSLDLRMNDLAGRIPAELDGLEKLTFLRLSANALGGSIPVGLGGLADLERLYLDSNNLVGSIPAELGELANLVDMDFSRNRLSGSIPADLGQLGNLTVLNFEDNDLGSSIPAELGGLANLRVLNLNSNDLSGHVPGELGNLASLERLFLSNNPLLSGALPDELANLDKLNTITLDGTRLCAPADPVFQSWIARSGVSVRSCEPVVTSTEVTYYLTQATQSLDRPIPLVAGDAALMRVFVTTRTDVANTPPIRVSLYHSGAPVQISETLATGTKVQSEVDVSSLLYSTNVHVPAELVKPGLEVVIEIDPKGTSGLYVEGGNRVPATGREAIEVRRLPTFNLTIVPFLWEEAPDYSVVTMTEGLTADDDLFWETKTLLPVSEMDVDVHAAVWTTVDPTFPDSDPDREVNLNRLISELEAIRTMEGNSRYYLGLLTPDETSGLGGIALLGSYYSLAKLHGLTMAHELGHNFNLLHAPCGADATDPNYPYNDGSIGVWGYDLRRNSLVSPDTWDLLSYCHPQWIGDYHFSKAMRYRLATHGAPRTVAFETASKTLLIWGGVTNAGALRLEPAFAVDAPASLPDGSGPYNLVGSDEDGRPLFSLDFDMSEIVDIDGGGTFAFAVPTRYEWAERLARITLSGPGGRVAIDGEGDRSTAILLDPASGQVRGILRDWPDPALIDVRARPALPEPGLDIMISRGVPGTASWRR